MARFTYDQIRIFGWLDGVQYATMPYLTKCFPDLGKDRVTTAIRSLQKRGLVYCLRGQFCREPEDSWGRGTYTTWGGDEFDDQQKAAQRVWLNGAAEKWLRDNPLPIQKVPDGTDAPAKQLTPRRRNAPIFTQSV